MKKSLVILVAVLSPLAWAAEKAPLNEQSKQLKAALEKIDSGGLKNFVKYFPKNREEFDRTCNAPYFDQLYDCSDVFSPGVERAILSAPEGMGAKLAILASEVAFSADAPNYLQRAWIKFCLSNPKAFAKSLEKLSQKKQGRAFKYLTRGIEFDDNSPLEACSDALKKAAYEKLSQTALQNRVKVNQQHH